MKTWFKDFIAAGWHRDLLQVVLSLAIFAFGFAFVHTEKPFWGITCLFYLICYKANELKEAIKDGRVIHVHNWNFIDRDGLPIIVSRNYQPEIKCPDCDKEIAEVKTI